MNLFQNLLINANFSFLMYKIPDWIESEAHKLSHAMTLHFRIPKGRFNYTVFCIVFAHRLPSYSYPFLWFSDYAQRTPVAAQSKLWSKLNGGLCFVSVLHWCQYRILTTTMRMASIKHQHMECYIWFNSKHPFLPGYMLLLLRGRIPTKKEVALTKIDQVCCPNWHLIDSCFLMLLMCPILNLVVSLGWRWRATINMGVGPAEKVGRLNLQNCLLLQGNEVVTLIGFLRPNIGRSEDATSATTTTQQQQ
jgi:hypothetical protein